MKSINTSVISGNLVREPRLSVTQSGTPVIAFTVAVDNRYYNKHTGKTVGGVSYIDCAAYGNLAEAMDTILGKGTRVTVSGYLTSYRWEHDGMSGSKVELTASAIEVLKRPGDRFFPKGTDHGDDITDQEDSFGEDEMFVDDEVFDSGEEVD